MPRRSLMCAAVLAFFLAVAPAMAQLTGYVESENHFAEGHNTPYCNLYLDYGLDQSFGFFSWTAINRETDYEGQWGESYVGVYAKPFSWLQVGVAYGAERFDDYEADATVTGGRFGSFLWMGVGRLNLTGYYEDGKSGTWHKEVLDFKIGKRFHFGAYDQTGLGTGPQVSVDVWHLNILAAVLYSEEIPHKELLTVRYSF